MLYKHLSRRTNVFATEQVYPGLNEQDARCVYINRDIDHDTDECVI